MCNFREPRKATRVPTPPHGPLAHLAALCCRARDSPSRHRFLVVPARFPHVCTPLPLPVPPLRLFCRWTRQLRRRDRWHGLRPLRACVLQLPAALRGGARVLQARQGLRGLEVPLLLQRGPVLVSSACRQLGRMLAVPSLRTQGRVTAPTSASPAYLDDTRGSLLSAFVVCSCFGNTHFCATCHEHPHVSRNRTFEHSQQFGCPNRRVSHSRAPRELLCFVSSHLRVPACSTAKTKGQRVRSLTARPARWASS